MGKILKPRGLNGQLWVAVFNEINSVLDTGMSIWISSKDGRNIHKIIDSIKFFSSKSLIKFKDCNSRNDVEKYVGLKFSISRSLFPALNDDEVYLVDLIGFTVYDRWELKFGRVVDTISLPNQNIIIVNSKDGEIMIPFVDAHIKLFDKKERKIIIDSIEGLVYWSKYIF